MKLYPLHKTPFGFIQMADEPLFDDLEFDLTELTKLQIKKGDREVSDLQGITPGFIKNHDTMFCLPTPKKGVPVSESQLSRMRIIAEQRQSFVQAIKDFIIKIRSSSNPLFPLDYPIERCIGDLSVIIPYEDAGIYLSFSYADWGKCNGLLLVFRNWDDIRECDLRIYPKLLGRRGVPLD